MRPSLLLALPILLAACQGGDPFAAITDGVARAPAAGPSAETRVADVAVRPDRLTLRMSDGARCVAFRPEGVQGGWSGVTADCGYQLPYAVTFAAPGGDPTRFTIEDGFGTVGADGRPGARAEVYVTDVDGIRKLFIRPMSEALFEVAGTAPPAPLPSAGAAPAAPAPLPSGLPPLPEAVLQ